MKTVSVFSRNSKGQIVLKDMRWGLIPANYSGRLADWSASTTHARIETVATTSSFENAWRLRRRVIFPLERYFEKACLGADLLGRKGKKEKVAISRADDKPMGVAGLYDYAVTLDGPVLSVAMLTRASGDRMLTIHDREPAVLEPEDWQAWLDGSDAIDPAIPWRDDAFKLEAAA